MNKQELLLWLRKSPTFLAGFILGVVTVSSGYLKIDASWMNDMAGPIASIILLFVSRQASIKNIESIKADTEVKIMGGLQSTLVNNDASTGTKDSGPGTEVKKPDLDIAKDKTPAPGVPFTGP
jgi:hypothetical protein